MKNPTQSSARRRSPRRTRSNSSSSVQEPNNPVPPPSTLKGTKKRRNSISGNDQEEQTPSQTQVTAVREQDDGDSEQALISKPSDVTGPDSEQQAAAGKLLSVSQAVGTDLLSNKSRLTELKHNKRDTEDKATGNELTKVIPGYVAPLQLDTSLLDAHRPSGGLDDLTRKAQETDASTAGFVVTASESHAQTMKRKSNGCMPSTYASLYSSFKRGTKPAPNHSAGAGWFDMIPTPMTDELKTDLAVIRNRNYLDPKRFYKSADDNKSKVLQLGTVVEGAAEFYSSRLVKKQRRTNLTEEIMADPAAADYTRNKYKRMQQEKTEKARKYNKKKKMSKRGRRGY